MSGTNFYFQDDEVKGEGIDEQGQYKWAGTISSDGKFNAEKVYDDAMLVFTGDVSEDQKTVNGACKETVNGTCNDFSFSFTRVVDWIGWYLHDEQKCSILMTEANFVVDIDNDDDEHITGSGTDIMGEYEWEGRFTKKGF